MTIAGTYELGDTVKTTATFRYDSTLTDPSGGTNPTCGVKVDVVKSDGTYLVQDQPVTRDSVGSYYYYFDTTSTDPYGIYIVVWKGHHNLVGYGYKPIIQREDILITKVD